MIMYKLCQAQSMTDVTGVLGVFLAIVCLIFTYMCSGIFIYLQEGYDFWQANANVHQWLISDNDKSQINEHVTQSEAVALHLQTHLWTREKNWIEVKE